MNPGQSSKRHKRIRLDRSCYAEPGAVCSVTIAAQDRRPVFADPLVAACAVDVLRRHAEDTGVPVFAYCVMPDHVHLVIGPSSTCDIITFIGQFKNFAQRAAWRLGVSGTFWQKSFWDHFLRADEDLERVVTYALNNPVRGGLVESWQAYRFVGSHYSVRSGERQMLLWLSIGH